MRMRVSLRSSVRYCSSVLVLLLAFVGLGGNSAYGQFSIVRVTPDLNALTASRVAEIYAVFSDPVNSTSVTPDRFRVYGQQTARYAGRLDIVGSKVSFVLTEPLKEGEVVTVFVSHEISSTTGSTLPQSYQWQFNVRPEFGSAEFEWVDPNNSLFRSPAVVNLGPQNGPVSTFIGDLNGDIFPDLVVANNSSNKVKIFKNTGSMEELFSQVLEIGVGEGPRSVVGGDLDLDGRLDLVVTSILDNTLTVLLNRGDRTEFNFEVHTVLTGARPIASTIIDYDGDGYLDIATASFGGDEIFLHRNDGTGTLIYERSIPTSQAPTSIVAGDFDRDGVPDLAIAAAGESRIEVFRNDRFLAFQTPQRIDLPYTPEELAVGDVLGATGGTTFGDGVLELVATAQDTNELTVYQIQSGLFVPVITLNPPSSQARGIVLADVQNLDTRAVQLGLGDEDADLDIVTTHFAESEVHVMVNVAAGESFRSDRLYEAGETPLGISAADLEADGDVDLVVANFTKDQIWIYFNRYGREGDQPIRPGVFDFGPVYTCRDSTITYTKLVNTTPFPVEISRLNVSPASSIFQVFTDPLPITLASGDTLLFDIKFDPIEPIQYDGFTIFVDYTFGTTDATTSILLSGDGIASHLEPVATIDFGNVVETESAVETFTLSNTGNAEITLTGASFTDPVFSSGQFFPLTIDAGGSSDISVTFSPLADVPYFGSVIFTTTDPCNPIFTVDLQGQGAELKPDLIAGSISGSVSPVLTRVEMYSGSYSVTRKDVSTPFSVQLLQDGVIRRERFYDGFSVGVQDTLNAEMIFNTPGSYKISLVVDTGNQVDEFNENNNVTELNVTPGVPDLIAGSISGNVSPVVTRVAEYSARFSLTRADIEVGTPFRVQLLQDNVLKREKVYSGFSVSASDTLNAEMTFTSLGPHTVSLVVDTEDQVGEFNENNNATVLNVNPIVGDLVAVRPNPFTPNGDGFNDRIEFYIGELALQAPALEIYTVEGIPIRELFDVSSFKLSWDGNDDAGRNQPAGVYLFLIKDADTVVKSGHITLAR